jgi:hypothetical protein
MANFLYRIDFGPDVLDGGSRLQKFVGTHVHLKGWEASDLELLSDKVVGLLVVLDGGKSHIAINELLINDSISHFHREAIELVPEPLALFAPFRIESK